MHQTARRRLLGVLVVLTLALLVADLAGSPVAAAVRTAAGATVGPVQRALSGAPQDEIARLAAENARLRVEAAEQARALAERDRVGALLESDAAAGRSLLTARVVATELSALGGRSLTLDAGSRDGVVVDATVVAAGGLVGRVVSVSPWTCDVQVLGAAGSVVGVRVGAAGTLATVGPPTASERVSRPRGTLTLTLVQPGLPAVGDVVRTLGSVGDVPYAAGLVVGTVVALDPDRGEVTRTATVRPAVDPDTIDVVAVLVPRARAVPRPTATGATGPTGAPAPTGSSGAGRASGAGGSRSPSGPSGAAAGGVAR